MRAAEVRGQRPAPTSLRAALRRWWVPDFRVSLDVYWYDVRRSFLLFVAVPCWLSLALALEPWGGLLVVLTPLPVVRSGYRPLYTRICFWLPAVRAWLRMCPTVSDAVDAQLAELHVWRDAHHPIAETVDRWRRPTSAAVADWN